ncbi:hypothetical protein [Aquimarina sp. 2201CG5-10]|uniref:hypothetical protein n=1 Tax=Aquimarina callyspongiae TaxID=3098150 RepID=UPI002AB512A8|nr:hypothetical protein [Aquimarina sp. 2201CG5-10]MDY8136875.1 hypothetical protein [Aquimarina sp. 2201CG5-10]
MIELKEYLITIAICSPVFLFIIGVIFRLLDNSASIFLNHEILVDSSYVSGDLIKEHINDSKDPKLKRSLKRALLFRRLHNFFMILMVISLPPVIIALFIVF